MKYCPFQSREDVKVNCSKDCNFYNEEYKLCDIKYIAEHLQISDRKKEIKSLAKLYSK